MVIVKIKILCRKHSHWAPGWCGLMDWALACELGVTGLVPGWGTCLGYGPGQVPIRGCVRGNHTLMFLSFSFSLSSPLSKINKIFKNKILRKKSHSEKTVIGTSLIFFDIIKMWKLVPIAIIVVGMNTSIFPNRCKLLMGRNSTQCFLTSPKYLNQSRGLVNVGWVD